MNFMLRCAAKPSRMKLLEPFSTIAKELGCSQWHRVELSMYRRIGRHNGTFSRVIERRPSSSTRGGPHEAYCTSVIITHSQAVNKIAEMVRRFDVTPQFLNG